MFNNVLSAKKLDETVLYFTGEILLQPKNNVIVSQIKALVNNQISVKSSTVHNTYVMNVNNWDSLFVYANRIYESGLNVAHNNISFNTNAFPSGIYVVTLICDGKVADSTFLIKQ